MLKLNHWLQIDCHPYLFSERPARVGVEEARLGLPRGFRGASSLPSTLCLLGVV